MIKDSTLPWVLTKATKAQLSWLCRQKPCWESTSLDQSRCIAQLLGPGESRHCTGRSCESTCNWLWIIPELAGKHRLLWTEGCGIWASTIWKLKEHVNVIKSMSSLPKEIPRSRGAAELAWETHSKPVEGPGCQWRFQIRWNCPSVISIYVQQRFPPAPPT